MMSKRQIEAENIVLRSIIMILFDRLHVNELTLLDSEINGYQGVLTVKHVPSLGMLQLHALTGEELLTRLGQAGERLANREPLTCEDKSALRILAANL